MAFQLTVFDRGLSDSVILTINNTIPVDGYPGPGAAGSKINFQFPPLIKSEDKKLEWMQIIKDFQWEPLYIWKAAMPRKINLTATYVVGGPPSGAIGRWTAEVVARETRRWKSYFYHDGGSSGGTLPVFSLNMYQHAPGGEGGQRPTLWRGTSVQFKYSDTVVAYDSPGNFKASFPLKTDVSVGLELVTNIKSDDDQTQFKYPNLTDIPVQEWY